MIASNHQQHWPWPCFCQEMNPPLRPLYISLYELVIRWTHNILNDNEKHKDTGISAFMSSSILTTLCQQSQHHYHNMHVLFCFNQKSHNWRKTRWEKNNALTNILNFYNCQREKLPSEGWWYAPTCVTPGVTASASASALSVSLYISCIDIYNVYYTMLRMFKYAM